MRTTLGLTFIIVASMLPSLAARGKSPASPAGAPGQAVQTQELPRSQTPDLGRPTKADDAPPVLDFGRYFNGTWTFTWDFPDSALGPAGGLTGTTEFRSIDDKFFEATTEATGDDGAVTIHESIGYLPDNHTLARMVNDSRGYSYVQIGTVGGDLGGQFFIYFDGAPFEHDGHTIRIKSTVRMTSPFNFRIKTTVSEDGGPYLNHGNPWWEKDVPGSTKQ